jgi:cytochrome P450 family 4
MAGSISVDQKAPPPSSAIFFSLLVPALILWYIYWRLSRRRLYALAEKLPGPEGLPLIGNALDLTGTSHSELIK